MKNLLKITLVVAIMFSFACEKSNLEYDARQDSIAAIEKKAKQDSINAAFATKARQDSIAAIETKAKQDSIAAAE